AEPGGDTLQSPTMAVEYALGNPTSRVIVRRRSQVGSPDFDMETASCADGRGRTYQTRTRIAPGSYQVDGLTTFNLRSKPVEVFQPYTSNVAGCETTAPGLS